MKYGLISSTTLCVFVLTQGKSKQITLNTFRRQFTVKSALDCVAIKHRRIYRLQHYSTNSAGSLSGWKDQSKNDVAPISITKCSDAGMTSQYLLRLLWRKLSQPRGISFIGCCAEKYWLALVCYWYVTPYL